ncbi:tRNA pseudouridine(13) synthase TruD [Candidatus Micrarchaeota archaeon CG1_02_55_22]|nr:MAG: tRNA pseudouridine(13) synthase TruD [Candidatus Micrarchaeota archaeon CG1_02_55_22]
MNAFEPEEFLVEEILSDGTVLALNESIDLGKEDDEALERDYFTHFVLQKRLWATSQAIAALAKALHVSQKRIDYAGMKDRNAVTTQLASVFAVDPGRVLTTRVKDVKINGAWKAREKIKLGALAGNRFTITLNERNCGIKPDAQAINEVAAKANYRLPNYFGSQRFGSLRGNTHKIGVLLCKGDVKSAVTEYLCETGGKEDSESREARKALRESGDYGKALKEFPRKLDIERSMIAWLEKKPNDYAGAFRTMHRRTQLLFIHAAQSLAFNIALRRRTEEKCLEDAEWWCPADVNGFPDLEKASTEKAAFALQAIPGYESQGGDYAKAALEEMGLTPESFNIKMFPELSSKGSLRPTAMPLVGFSGVQEGDAAKLRFSLPSGSYATVAIDLLLGKSLEYTSN